MPLYTADALILRTYKLAEADRIVVFLTRDRGKKRGVAKGARKSRQRFGGGLEPLTRASVAYFEREHRELVRLEYIEPLRSPFSIRTVEALGHAGYFAELIDEWAAEADPNERLYRLGASALEALTAGVDVDRLARYFEYWVLRLQGVYPSLTGCQACRTALDGGARLLPVERAFLCRACGEKVGGLDMSRGALAFLRACADAGPARLGDVDLTWRAERQLAAAHRALITTFLEKELKSVRVLHELRPARPTHAAHS